MPREKFATTLRYMTLLNYKVWYAKANRFGETVSLLPLHANNLRLGVNSLL